MMTGAILGGSSVEQAAKLQMVIMFMISSASALSSMMVTIFALMIVTDSGHRIRSEKVDTRQHAMWRARDKGWSWVVMGAKAMFSRQSPRSKEEVVKAVGSVSKRQRRGLSCGDLGQEFERLLG